MGCPDWSLKKIVDCSVENGYKGFEIRGLAGEMDLPKCSEFSKTNLPASLRLIKDNDIKIINLGSSANLHFAQEEKGNQI